MFFRNCFLSSGINFLFFLGIGIVEVVLQLCWSVSLVRDVKAIWSNLQTSRFIWTQKVHYRRTLFRARPGPASELAHYPPPNSHRILFQHHTRSSFEASQALSWRSICWHQSMWTIEELSSSELAQDPLQSSPRSSSWFAQGPIQCSHGILFRHQRIQVGGSSVCWLTCCQATICFKRWYHRTSFACKTDFVHTPIIHYQFTGNVV